jgi:hypothetical protein
MANETYHEVPRDGGTADGIESYKLTPEDFGPNGELKTKQAELALVLQTFQKSSEWVAQKQWNLLWRDADILYAAPRPQNVFEGSATMEPNVVRWTVAKVVQSIVPKIHKGLFLDDPPFQMNPRPGISADTVRAKEALFSYLLDECEFKTETEAAMEQFVLLGTCIVKWGYETRKVKVCTRKPTQATIPGGVGGDKNDTTITTDEAPKLEEKEVLRTCPTFEFRDLRDVFVDAKLKRGDIRKADSVIDRRYLDYYQVMALKDDPEWDITDDIIEIWTGTPAAADNEQGHAPTTVEQMTSVQSIVHHGMDDNLESSPDPLRKKLEVLEYQDCERIVAVLNRKKVIRSRPNKFGVVTYYSANWWNRPKAFYGIGAGLIVGQNQRVDSGTINAILKILSFGVNPTYARNRESSAPTQMIRTGIGRIITVDGDADKAFKLIETPKVPAETWQALRESQQATEESSGADAMLVQGNTTGGRSSMGRTAGGAGILSDAADSRLEGPLDRFINQIFVPWLYQLDKIVKYYMPDSEIQEILGERLAADAKVNMAEFFGTFEKSQFEVLAGASIRARRAMAQQILTISQFFMNPQIISQLAEVNGVYIDMFEFEKMLSQSMGIKNFYSLFKPLTPEMKAAQQQKNQQGKLQEKMALSQQKHQQDLERDQAQSEERQQAHMNEILVKESIKHTMSGSEETGGVED